MRALLTGGSGFVGGWLSAHLTSAGDEVSDLPEGLDVRDAPAVARHVVACAPDVVYHLAALSHVGRSWEHPAETLEVNVLGTSSVLEAARRCDSPPRVILISSAEVYGSGTGAPLDESAELRPVSPYAASKVAAEFLGV
ncbi:MAG: nucleoside-diphosphate-sugar epimerase, partial [Acidimicrobiaceae bacterium]|nr:nucleoside-diphosphate-sugar epimerase [Acidimicrobiaceae bacterium]